MYGLNANRPASPFVPVVNSDPNEAVPPYGLMQPIGDPVNGASIIGRPDGNSVDLLVNGLTAIPRQVSASTTDNVGSGHQEFPTVVAYQNDNDGGLAPQVGEVWGPKAGSWYLHKGGRGFRIYGGGSNGLVNVVQSGAREPQRVQLLTHLDPCGSATAIEMNYNTTRGDWCDFGNQITVYDSTSIVQTEIDPGFWLWVTFQPDSQRWEVESIGSDGCCGGSSGSGSSGSGPAPTCPSIVGGVDLTKLEMLDPNGSAPLAMYLQDNCWRLGPTKQCPGSGSGS